MKTATSRAYMLLNQLVIGLLLATVPLAPELVQGQEGRLRDLIDREIKEAWEKDNVRPPERASDSVFLRRIYLDLVGMIPTYEETTNFLADTDPQKREKLIDVLLTDLRYARNQAQVWDVYLLGRNPNGIGHPDNRRAFSEWLELQFRNNERYDRFVYKLLAAEEVGSQLYYVVYRNSDDLATTTMRMFLGTQLQCAKCHDHPYDPWTQRDYYGMAGFFVRTFVTEGEKQGNATRYFVGEKSTGEVSFTIIPKDAPPGTKGEPVRPKFLGGDELQEPALPKDFKEPKVEPKQAPTKPLFSRREKIVEWLTAKSNPYLARAALNRIWAQFMGRGFVHPVDDFNAANVPTHPKLLQEIELQLIAHQFDLKWLIREIVNSQVYQTADVGPVTEALPKHYERARIRPLSVEELIASLHVATGLGIEAALKSRPSADMVKYLGESVDGQGKFQGSLTEHLFIHNGDTFRGLCSPRSGNLAEAMLKSDADWNAKIERIFLSILSRTPSVDERERFIKYLGVDASDKKLAAQRMEEVLWVLIASSEFRFNR